MSESQLTKRLTIPAAEEILDLYFPVLDHGFIALKDYMGGDEAIDEAARTSYGAGTRKISQRRGLIRTLRRNLHTSPFEMCELKFHCSMPIFIARQWIRHRTASVNEYSGRYSVIPMMFYMPAPEQLRQQSTSNKQGRGKAVSDENAAAAYRMLSNQRARIAENYEWMVGEDFARELARIDLPLSAYTQWYWKIDLHNLLHFLGLRCDGHAQYEIRVFADIMAGMVRRLAPLSFEAWIDYFFAGARMSRMEMEILRKLLAVEPDGYLGDPAKPVRKLAVPDAVILDGPFATEKNMEMAGLTKTEIGEFFSKLAPKEVPSFELDLSLAKDGAFFSQQWEAAVPKIDRVSV